ncbi:MAG TPA: hypothetical protein VN081_04880 [Dongiaceae bacterium]|nr:hypothetical protein [Dongiaceae bacterium]
MDHASEKPKVKSIPFNRSWIDANGFMTQAWDALKEHPEVTVLTGHIDADLDEFTANRFVENRSGEKVSIKQFSIEAGIVKQFFTYKRFFQSSVNFGPKEPLDYIAIPAVAIIRPGTVEIHTDTIHPRGRTTLLEKWILTSELHAMGVSRYTHFKRHGWRMVERTVNIGYHISSNEWPANTYEFIREYISRVFQEIRSRGGMEIENREMEEWLKEQWRKVGSLRGGFTLMDDALRLSYSEIVQRWYNKETNDKTFQKAWNELDLVLYGT